PGGITGMLRICKKRRYAWIGLAGPQFKVYVLGIPARQRGVMLRDGLIGICSCGARCVYVQMILEDLQIKLLKPGLEKSGLPEPGEVVGGVRRAQIFNRGILAVGHVGSEYGGWTRPELLRRSQHPGFPGSGERSHRRVAAPQAGSGRIRAVEG